MASSEGVGARMAWTRNSAQVRIELISVLAPYPVERLGFEEGTELQRRLLEDYRCAHASRNILHEGFESEALFNQALILRLKDLDQTAAVTLLLQDAEAKGVYRTTVEAIRYKALDLLRYDGDSVLLAADGTGRGYLLDREVTDSDKEVLEMEFWRRSDS